MRPTAQVGVHSIVLVTDGHHSHRSSMVGRQSPGVSRVQSRVTNIVTVDGDCSGAPDDIIALLLDQ